MELITPYLIVINIVTFVVMYLDKNRAVNQQFRIPEKTLYLLTLMGGGAGMLAAMKILRHKSSKKSFQAVISLILFMQILLLYLFIK